jgi:hypothetical protein
VCGQRLVRIKRGRWVLTREIHQHASELYGPTFARCWPVDQSFCFDELLDAIDAATPDARRAVRNKTS